MVTNSKVIGYQPRIMIRRNFCTACSLRKEDPIAHELFMELARIVSGIYFKLAPEMYSLHCSLIENFVLTEWRIFGTPFTSGIINKTTSLKYHYDAGNFKNVRSAMICFKAGIDGGNLSIPEFGIKLAIGNNTITIFDGSKILHGVTPIFKTNPSGFRFPVVFYSLLEMKNCFDMGGLEEVKKFMKTED